jgi:hypothetical protein
MIFADHRLSRDIDAFIDDPQYLALLSPETTDVWKCSAWDRAAHYLKLKYPEGEVDFIVTAAISSLPPVEKQINLTGIRKESKPTIRLDPPAEIALKKLHYRATMLKPRDVFDISVTDAIDGDALIANLHEVADKKDDLLTAPRPYKGGLPAGGARHSTAMGEAQKDLLGDRPRYRRTYSEGHRMNAQHSSWPNRFARYVQNRKHLPFRSAFSLDVSERESKIAKSLKRLERVKGIEPSYSAWKSPDFPNVFNAHSDILQLSGRLRSLQNFPLSECLASLMSDLRVYGNP